MSLKTSAATLAAALFVLAGCSRETPEPREDAGAVVPPAAQPVADAGPEATAPLPKYYCFLRVGQIRAEPRRGEACDVDASGSREIMQGLARPERNAAVISISSPVLEDITIKAFFFSVNRGAGLDPKILPGVYEMEQYKTSMDLKDLPDTLAHGWSRTDNSLFTHTSPDAAAIRAADGGAHENAGFEIASAVLTINAAEDVLLELDAMESTMMRQMGMVQGQQYVQGSLKVSLIPISSKGETFGPTTFHFATNLDWAYLKE